MHLVFYHFFTPLTFIVGVSKSWTKKTVEECLNFQYGKVMLLYTSFEGLDI